MPLFTDPGRFPPCIVRLPSLARAAEDAAGWSAVGATAVLAPVTPGLGLPRQALGPAVPEAPRDEGMPEDTEESPGARIAEAAVRLDDAGLGCYLEVLLDPRPPRAALDAPPLVDTPSEAFLQAWQARLSSWAGHGVAGFCFVRPQGLAPAVWRELLAGLRAAHPALSLIAWTPGMASEELAVRRDAGFDWVVSSLAWWDCRADWLAEEDARLRDLAPVLAYPGAGTDPRRLWAAAVSGDGIVLDGRAGPCAALAPVMDWRRRTALQGPLRAVGGRGGRATVLLRRDAAGTGVVLALAPEPGRPAVLDLPALDALLPPGAPAPAEAGGRLPAQGWALIEWGAARPVGKPARAPALAPATASRVPRIGIENVAPAVDGGAWPVKRIVHEMLRVEADVFVDGHQPLAVDLCWRACDEEAWRRVPMSPLGNDRWRAECRPDRVGAHEYRIQAWLDDWAGFRHAWRVGFEAGQDLGLSLREGELWLARVLEAAAAAGEDGPEWAPARAALAALEGTRGGPPDARLVEQLLAEPLATLLRHPGERPFACASPAMPLRVDRAQARYGSWYELFPRSQSPEPGRHGTLEDVMGRLPDIRRMGFDVLYLTPIHPIGRTNRKGRDNHPAAQPGDVGSPYAIGSPEGGHDAVEPLLGSLADFDRLVAAARAEGLEIALDFAIQCSPDHPWLRDHPDWFQWRPDGSLRHAENPPKKYEDIVNVEFYGGPPQWRRKPALWRALRDIVLFWMAHGVRIFRVDNPHTKPLPFWHWMISEVQAREPGAIFLSEAFTRPAMMHRLSKIGFTQSYTYFTWRNEAGELDAYLAELSRPPLAEFFRPHFFVNTPDINPHYLQGHGRPGFLARAALAATSAGLWGVYSGFELCEAEPLPGREEYANSEKYELRPRDWHAPGNIRAEIARLNEIRRANPALQGHRGYRGLPSEPPSVLAYVRWAPDGGNVLLVMVNLDPERPVDAGARLDGPTGAENLLTGAQEHWGDGWARARLVPEAPYGIWRLPPAPVEP